MPDTNMTYDGRAAECSRIPAPDAQLRTFEDTFEALFGWLGRAGAHVDVNRKI